MSEYFDKLLLDLGEADLVAAIAPAGCQLLRGFREEAWRPIVAEVAALPEGRRQLDHPARVRGKSCLRYLVVAWWTDHQGRKHVRVVSDMSPVKRPDLHIAGGPRPPLWHVCPRRVARVKRG